MTDDMSIIQDINDIKTCRIRVINYRITQLPNDYILRTTFLVGKVVVNIEYWILYLTPRLCDAISQALPINRCNFEIYLVIQDPI